MTDNTLSADDVSRPSPSRIEQSFQSLLNHADVKINGDRDWDIQVHNQNLYSRLLRENYLGLAETYIDGWWSCEKLDQMFTRVINAKLEKKFVGKARVDFIVNVIIHTLFNFQRKSRAHIVGDVHYNIGNDLYQKMLDPAMIYSCGYWKNANNLAEAQQHKLDLICRKLDLKPGMTLLDIGCGWGGLAAYAARHYHVKVTGVTISKEQKWLAEKIVNGLPVEILLCDYRSVTGKFDRIVSVGMFEHVGPKNYLTYFKTVKNLLAQDGLFLLHTIGAEYANSAPDPFIHKYIFPNGKIPSREQINNASINLLRLEDWHNFGPDYDTTLMAWASNFERSWPQLKEKYSQRFYRMWRYYLYVCAGFFRSRKGQLWQIVYAHPDRIKRYDSLR